MGDDSNKLALGAMLRASAAQQMLLGDEEVSFLAAARAAKAKQEAQKMNKDVQHKIRKAIDVARKLKKLDLSGLGLTEIPPQVWELNDLKVMWLQDNQLTEIPPEISKLEELNQKMQEDYDKITAGYQQLQASDDVADIHELMKTYKIFGDDNNIR
jgi:hypothetical protein